jgi:hypothetical protein
MEWRYFQLHSRTGRSYELYRFPVNGKGLFEQQIDDVERYRQGSWRGGVRNVLIDEALKGWFDESEDEVSEEQAVLLMSKMSGGA